MALGIYRTTEDGNQRVLENSVDLRVTENYIEAEASVSASGTLAAVGNLVLPASISVNASSTLSSTATVTRFGAVLVANNSTLVALPSRTTRGEFNATATGTMLATPTFKGSVITNLVASSTVTADSRTVKFVSVASGDVEFERITEIENTRITEDGNVRITNPIRTNIILGSVVASADLIPFSSIAYIKIGGVWKEVRDIDVKQAGDWGYLDKIYRNMSGKWKRIY